MLIHPQFDPIAVAIGPLAVRWYGLMYVLAFAAFILLGRLRIKTRPETRWSNTELDDLLFWGVFGGLKLWGDWFNSSIGLGPLLGIKSDLDGPLMHRMSLMNITLIAGGKVAYVAAQVGGDVVVASDGAQGGQRGIHARTGACPVGRGCMRCLWGDRVLCFIF